MSASPSRYRILQKLGEGGMGEVFLADDTQLGRKVAVKFLTEALEADATARERLHREARSAAALDHPYICKIYEIAEVDGRTGIVMEHVSGETLQATLARGPLAPQRALEIAGEIAEALDEAHTHRLVHRDLKPANVMLTAQGHVKVMDFGLAKAIESASGPLDDVDSAETIGPITESGVRVGTPGYMAPEQLLGAQADARSDIFAFGILLYEMLAGVHPFHRTSQSGTMAAILRDQPPPVTQYQGTLPDSAKTALDRMLAKDPGQRHHSFVDIRADLNRLLDDVSGMTPAATPAPPVSTDETPSRSRTPYVGRETECAEIRRLLDQAVAGRGATVLVGGEPGVGKTRFTEELVREARERGCLTLVGHCYETEGQPPFIPFVEILERSAKIADRATFREALGDAAPEVAKIAPELRRLFPDIPAPLELPPDQQRRFLFNAYQAFTERSARLMPIVLVLEDLHWADEPTVLLMQHLAQHLALLPLLVIGTYRDVELDVGRPFARVLESLVRERLATRISLRRLPETDVVTLLAALGGPDPPAALARVVYHETEGNPFFVEEVFQHLKEEGRLFDDAGGWRSDLDTGELQVPEGVRLVIGRRLERVSDDTRKALTVAAVIGRNFELSVLEAAAGIESDALLDALEEAEHAQLITSAASGREIRYTFSHELIRQTLNTNLSLPRQQRIHLRVAQAIESANPEAPKQQAATLAHHFYQAGSLADADTTLRHLTTAGRQALSAAAFEDAVAHFTTALSFDRLDAKARADLLYERGWALRSLAQADDAIADWQTSFSASVSLGDSASVARTAAELGLILLWQDRKVEALALAERAEHAVPRSVSADWTRVLTLLGHCRCLLGDYANGRRLLTEARDIVTRLSDDARPYEVLWMEAGAHWNFFKTRQTLEAGEVVLKMAGLSRDPWAHASTLLFRAQALASGGMPEEARTVAEEVERLGAKVGFDGAVMTGIQTRMTAAVMLTGDLQVVDQLVQDLEAASGRAGPWSWIAQLYRSQAHFWAGAWDEAAKCAAEALNQARPETFGEIAVGWQILLQAYRGDRGWLGEYRNRRDRLFREGRTPFAGDRGFAAIAAEGLVLIGAQDDALRLYPILSELLDDGCVTGVGTLSLVETQAGIAAAAGGEWDTAQQHFETALQQAHDVPNKLAQPETRRWYAWMLLDRDAPSDRDRARTLLGEAIDLYQTIGMPKHVEIAEKMLAGARK